MRLRKRAPPPPPTILGGGEKPPWNTKYAIRSPIVWDERCCQISTSPPNTLVPFLASIDPVFSDELQKLKKFSFETLDTSSCISMRIERMSKIILRIEFSTDWYRTVKTSEQGELSFSSWLFQLSK